MTKIVIACDDVSDSLEFYTGELGFRVDSIFPADSPRRASLSGYGIVVELCGPGGEAPDSVACEPALVVTKIGDGGFGTGRAGMQYRDLVPTRYGGHFIASHIRIPAGGPVPDYVHHHAIRFQLIFCVNGWVRVAYEDQGEPMRMEAGDCFLQPPHIRHRVLECSDNMEVVEMTCPAEHETSVDHAMTLPTQTIDTERAFGGQRFVFHQAAKAPWLLSDVKGARYQNLGLAAATGGVVSAIVISAHDAGGSLSLLHNGELRFIYVIRGSAGFTGSDTGRLEIGDAVSAPAACDMAIDNLSADFMALEIDVPR